MIVTASAAYDASYSNWLRDKEKELKIIDKFIKDAIDARQFYCSIEWIELGRKYFHNTSIDDVNIFFAGAKSDYQEAVEINRQELFTILTDMGYGIKFWNDQYFILNWDCRKLWKD